MTNPNVYFYGTNLYRKWPKYFLKFYHVFVGESDVDVDNQRDKRAHRILGRVPQGRRRAEAESGAVQGPHRQATHAGSVQTFGRQSSPRSSLHHRESAELNTWKPLRGSLFYSFTICSFQKFLHKTPGDCLDCL